MLLQLMHDVIGNSVAFVFCQFLAKSAHKFARALEKRDALDKWTAHLKVARAQASGANVTAIRKS
jgi:hypothetical protein